MRGKVLEHESKTIFNEGRKKQATETVRRGLDAGMDAVFLSEVAGVDVAFVERIRDAMVVEPRRSPNGALARRG